MNEFEYEITKHGADEFYQLVYFCSETGECGLEHVPLCQTRILEEILNKRGSQGWELIQVSFGKDGVMAFWKRSVAD